MVEQATLSVTIDASEAKKGAAEFSRSAAEIKKKATEIAGAFERSKRSFKGLRAESKQGLGASGLSDEQINSINQQISSIDKSLEKSKLSSFLSSLLKPIFGVPAATAINIAQGNLEEEKRRLESEKQIINEDATGKQFVDAADRAVNPVLREKALISALERLRNAQALEKASIAPILEREQAAVSNIEEFRTKTGEDAFTVDPRKASFAANFFLQGLRDIEKELEEPRAKLEARGEAIAALQAELDRLLEAQIEAKLENPLAGSEDAIPQVIDDDNVQKQIDDTNRSIDLLKEQRTMIEGSAATATAQKQLELDLLQREKDCLVQLNETLRENATLRGEAQSQTKAQSETTVESEAANDNLSQALEDSGRQVQQLQEDLAALNEKLQDNAALTAMIVDQLNKELDARKSVNNEVVERRELEPAREQQVIAEDEEEAKRRGEAVEASINQIRDAAKDAFKDVIKGTESVGDAFQNLADRITDILLDLALEELLSGGTGFSDLFGTIFGGIGSIFGGGSAPITSPIGPGSLVGLRPDLIDTLFFHRGGIVGETRTIQRALSPLVFAGAPRFHDGGVVGLHPDDVPIIARRGEEVITTNDNRHRDNSGTVGGNVVVNVNFPNARNTQEAREAGGEIAAKAAAAAQRGMARKGLG